MKINHHEVFIRTISQGKSILRQFLRKREKLSISYNVTSFKHSEILNKFSINLKI